MQIQQLNRSDAEKVSIIVKNVDGGGSLSVGRGVALVVAGASIDGVSAVAQAASAQSLGFVGVAVQNIPINGYGLVRSWGHVASVLLSHEGSSKTITAGDVLVPSGLAGAFASSVTAQGMSTLYYRYIVAAKTVSPAISSAAYIEGIVRAL